MARGTKRHLTVHEHGAVDVSSLDSLDKALLMVLGRRKQVKTYDLLKLGLSPRLGDRLLEQKLHVFEDRGWVRIDSVQPSPFDGHYLCRITEMGGEAGRLVSEEEMRDDYPALLRLLAEHFLFQLPPQVAKPPIEEIEELLKSSG